MAYAWLVNIPHLAYSGMLPECLEDDLELRKSRQPLRSIFILHKLPIKVRREGAVVFGHVLVLSHLLGGHAYSPSLGFFHLVVGHLGVAIDGADQVCDVRVVFGGSADDF